MKRGFKIKNHSLQLRASHFLAIFALFNQIFPISCFKVEFSVAPVFCWSWTARSRVALRILRTDSTPLEALTNWPRISHSLNIVGSCSGSTSITAAAFSNSLMICNLQKKEDEIRAVSGNINVVMPNIYSNVCLLHYLRIALLVGALRGRRSQHRNKLFLYRFKIRWLPGYQPIQKRLLCCISGDVIQLWKVG